MNKSMLFTVIGSVLFAFVLPGYCEEPAKVFQLTLTSDKTVVTAGERIEFQIIFKNLSPEDRYMYIENIDNADVFTITDTEGNIHPAVITVAYDMMWDEKNYKLVKTGEEYSWKITATIRKEKEYVLDFGDSVITVAHPGKCQVVVTYHGWDGIVTDTEGKQIALSKKLGLKNVFVDTVVSNTMMIEIQ